ncbi:MAG: hypothetical protein ACFFEY_16350 [Candidatus Thorarchaeota archaeon]
MYYKKKIQILLGFMVVFLIIGSTLITSVNLNSPKGNTTPSESTNNQNITSQNGLINALGDESTDDFTKISDTYEFLKSKLYSFGQRGQDITVSNSEVETDDSIINIITIQVENETHIETLTFTAKIDKEHYSGPINEDVDFLLTPDDAEHHSAITFPPILMGWQWGWWYHYEWEYEIKVKILWWWITTFHAYFEVSVGAIFQFHMPVSLTANFPDDIFPGDIVDIPLTLTALDLKNPGGQEYYEFALGAGLILKAGAYVLGVIGFGFELDFGWFKYQSYKTPLGEPWYPTDPIPIGIIGLAAKVVPAYLKPILEFIADNLLDACIFIYPGIGSHKVTAQATVYGTDVTIDGVTSKEIKWETSPDTETITLATSGSTTDIVLALSQFTIHFNEFWLKLDFALDYQWILEPILGDYTSWTIAEFGFETPLIFTMESPQTVYKAFRVTPIDYGVELDDIIPSPRDIEPGEAASYTLSITNTGNTIDTVELSVSEVSEINPAWVIFYPKFITLNPSETKTVEMIVYPPRDYTTLAGLYTLTIEAKSLGNPDEISVKSGDVNIKAFYDVAVTGIYYAESGVLEIPCQHTDVLEFEVQNLGNTVEKFDLSVSTDLGSFLPEGEQIELPPGETGTVQVEITPPFLHTGNYEVILIGTSTSDPEISNDGKLIIRVLPTQDSIIHFLNMMIDGLYNEIPENAWEKLSRRNAMTRRIFALIDTMSGCTPDFYEEAYDRLLREIKPKLTGLKTDEEEIPWDGGIYENPWIIDELYQEILQYTCNQLLIDVRTLIAISN